MNAQPARILAVDLDGTLIQTDLLVESALATCLRHPATVFAWPFWLSQGKAAFKEKLAVLGEIDIAGLPWNEPFLAWLREQRQSGRKLVLATASDKSLADKIEDHLGLFDAVLASDGVNNLRAEAKCAALVAAYGEGNFDYAGNSADDLAVWRAAGEAITVNIDAKLRSRITVPVAHDFPRQANGIAAWFKAIRLHQWLKNLLLFVPLLAAHRFTAESWFQAIGGFLAFGLCASSVYLVNDLLDLTADRHHPRKKRRPFAAGRLSIVSGVAVAPLMLLAALAGAYWLSPPFAGVLAGYYGLTLAYSLKLKRVATIDVLTLAGLYTLRIVSGAVLTQVPPSFWLLAFAMFFFLSLAFLKRYTELVDSAGRGNAKIRGRGYRDHDATLIAMQGVAAGYTSVMVLALYLDSRDVAVLYSQPRWLWGICVLLLYWLNRSWWLAHHGQLHDDPVIYAVTDRTSLVTFAIVLACLAIASRPFL